jgi:hypothetical protein
LMRERPLRCQQNRLNPLYQLFELRFHRRLDRGVFPFYSCGKNTRNEKNSISALVDCKLLLRRLNIGIDQMKHKNASIPDFIAFHAFFYGQIHSLDSQ